MVRGKYWIYSGYLNSKACCFYAQYIFAYWHRAIGNFHVSKLKLSDFTMRGSLFDFCIVNLHIDIPVLT